MHFLFGQIRRNVKLLWHALDDGCLVQTRIDLIDNKISVGDIGEIAYSSKASFYKNDDGILEIKIGD